MQRDLQTIGHAPGLIALIASEFEARIVRGISDYGKPLATFNGRVALVDAYQEQLDAAHYLKQDLLEFVDNTGKYEHESPTYHIYRLTLLSLVHTRKAILTRSSELGLPEP